MNAAAHHIFGSNHFQLFFNSPTQRHSVLFNSFKILAHKFYSFVFLLSFSFCFNEQGLITLFFLFNCFSTLASTITAVELIQNACTTVLLFCVSSLFLVLFQRSKFYSFLSVFLSKLIVLFGLFFCLFLINVLFSLIFDFAVFVFCVLSYSHDSSSSTVPCCISFFVNLLYLYF